jgi:transposase
MGGFAHKNTYLSAQYRRIAAKRRPKRASLAVAHTILVIAYHMLKSKVRYHELGGDYFDRTRTAGLKRYYLKRLEQLGVSVTESPAASGS